MFGSRHNTSSIPPDPEKKAHSLPAINESKNLVDPTSARDVVGEAVREHMGGESQNTEYVQRVSFLDIRQDTPEFRSAKGKILSKLVDQVDFISLNKLNEAVQKTKVLEVCDKIISDIQLPLTAEQIRILKEQSLDELFGFGPIEVLLNDPNISDIMINGASQVYIEKQGKILLSDITFLNEQHLLTIIQRIVGRVGRRVDESSPMVDARMPDGSRFNAIIPPLALDGSLVSIRKFKKNKMPLSDYTNYDSMTEAMCKFLHLCSKCRLNMIVSGGTGSGKTTLLNALSGGIGIGERVITIEDAAELQLHQPHVLRLETRPSSIEGKGEINQRMLVKNALRMRPDRIILGEVRGDEIIDLLSAMNTGHDGSMATIHANTPRDCLSRVENLVGMSGINLGEKTLRQQIASALQIIVQISRMRDGKRRITSIEEVVGIEGEMITTQTLFSFQPRGTKANGDIDGEFVCHGVRPRMIARAEYFDCVKEVLECFKIAG